MLTAFFAFTLPLMPLQLLFRRLGSSYSRTFPQWYHRQVCRILSIRIDVDGALARQGGVLLVANHVSWIDIPVLSAVAPVSFIAKREVGTWPFVRWLATLQRSVFIDRERRMEVGEASDVILQRLAKGDNLVLFAEGTSGPGNKVLPFRTALFGAVRGSRAVRDDISVQTLAIAYTRVQGLPIGRNERAAIGWYGDMEMASHGWELLQLGPIDARIKIGPPVALQEFSNRKALARWCEDEVRRDLAALLHGRVGDNDRPAGATHGRAAAAPLESRLETEEA